MTAAPNKFVGGERAIAAFSSSFVGAGCVPPPAPPELNRYALVVRRKLAETVHASDNSSTHSKRRNHE